jgi:hypothetical protein
MVGKYGIKPASIVTNIPIEIPKIHGHSKWQNHRTKWLLFPASHASLPKVT